MKNKKGKLNFNYQEEFITPKENISKEELKIIFNQKYFNYLKRIERRKYEGDKTE